MNKISIKRRILNVIFYVLSAIALLLLVTPLVSIFSAVLIEGVKALSWDMFTKLPQPPGSKGGGIANAIQGTLILVSLSSAISIPIGFLAGIFMSEYSENGLSSFLKSITEILSGIPSIIAGLFVFSVVVLPMGTFSALAGALALSVLSIPLIARATESALASVPRDIREAALALGIPKWKAIVWIVVRAASGGIIAGIMLSIARVAGETAPLLFTAFGSQYFAKSLLEPVTALPLVIYVYGSSPWEEWVRLAWGASLLLVITVTMISVIVKERYGK